MSSSTTRARHHPPFVTRIGRCTTRWRLGARPAGSLPLVNYHWTLVGNVKRDPFEQTVSFGDAKSAMALGGTLGSPSTAYLYDWNMLPIGQQLWEMELYSFKDFPPLRAAETYNLDGILAEMEKHKGDDPWFKSDG